MIKNNIALYIISDSVGRTGRAVVDAVISQYPDLNFNIIVHNFVKSHAELLDILADVAKDKGIIAHTLAEQGLNRLMHKTCSEKKIDHFDLLRPLMNMIQRQSGMDPLYKVGAPRLMDEKYFDRVNSIEFAVTYDDGQNTSGLLLADIILLGASRTSKTPLSIYLANMSYKVANWPVYPEVSIPEDLKLINPGKIIGLTNDPETLKKIRQERMISYGMDPDSIYASDERIMDELAHTHKIYRELGCLVINVSNRSIEETATMILDHLNKEASD